MFTVLVVEVMCLKVYFYKNGSRGAEVFKYEKELNIGQESDTELEIENDKEFGEERQSISDDVRQLFGKYPDLKAIESDYIKLPYFSAMVPQGLTIMNEFVIMTAYDSSGEDYSRCYIFDRNSKEMIHTTVLDVKSHVGGIAYDSKNELFWISDAEGLVRAYPSYDILNGDKVESKYKLDLVKSFLAYKNKFSSYIDYLCVDDEYLYVGNFVTCEKGLIQKYRIAPTEVGIELIFVSDYWIPTLVQGVSFYKHDNQKYMVLSRSLGRNNNSHLEVFRFDENIRDYTDSSLEKVSLELPPMLEQNAIYDDKVYMIFESNAKKYEDCLVKIDRILVLDLGKILLKLKK